MPYQYKFIPSGASIQRTAKKEFEDLAQEDLNQMFYEADNVYTIQEETAFASGQYQNVDVRLNRVVNLQTGERIGDDFRKLSFKDLEHPVDLGRYYQFDSNYWIAINTEKIKLHAPTVTVKRCNNSLRWMDDNGGMHVVPCSIGYLLKENRDYSTAGSNMVVPSGMIDVIVPRNALTNTLYPNQRFLIGVEGRFTAYRIEGGGINNFNNTETMNEESAGLLRLSLAVDFSNEHDDDLVNGIADVGAYEYTITLNQNAIFGDAGQTVQLQALLTVNGQTVTRTLVWESNDVEVATVNSSGLVTFVAEGLATITCSLENNSNISDTCSVEVGLVPVDNYQVIYSPTTNYIIEGENETYAVYLYKNGVQQADAFVFSLDANGIPSANYLYEALDDNHFKITNLKMYLTDTLDVICVSGVYSIRVQIKLRGAW